MCLICFYVDKHILSLAEEEASLGGGCRVIYKEVLPLQIQTRSGFGGKVAPLPHSLSL